MVKKRKLVRRIDDDRACPEVGEIIGKADGLFVMVAWGEDRKRIWPIGTPEAVDGLSSCSEQA
jgi:hypothetical protein